MVSSLRPTLNSIQQLARLTPRTPPSVFRGVPGAVRALAHRRPDSPALRTLEGTLTWGDLDAEVDRRAVFWRLAGLNRGDCVALLLGNRAEVILQQLAVSRVGGVTALVDHTLRGRGLQHIMDSARSRAAVVDSEGETALSGVEFRGDLGVWMGTDEPSPGDLRSLLRALGPVPASPLGDPLVRLDDLYTYVFTSGTTGLPKAARIRHHRWLLAGAGFQAFALWLKPTDVLFTPLPLHHSSAQMIGFSVAIAAECCFAVAPRFSAREYWSQVRDLGATVGVYVGEMCRYLKQSGSEEGGPGERGHGMHTMVGNGLRPDVWPTLVERFGVERVVEFYGATEGNLILVNRDGKPGSCGRLLPIFRGPLDGLALVQYDVEGETHPRSADGHLIRCATGEAGELLGRITALPTERFDGYMDPSATQGKILRDVFRKGDAYFRTGDLLKRDAEGDYFFIDRIGDTFRWKGENVSTQEVALALADSVLANREHALVMIYGVEIPGCEGRAGMAAVVADARTFAPKAAWKAATERLPLAARPAFIRLCASLETTGTMKFRKAAFQAEGFGEGVPAQDTLYVRLDAKKTYAPLTPALRAQILDGTLRL